VVLVAAALLLSRVATPRKVALVLCQFHLVLHLADRLARFRSQSGRLLVAPVPVQVCPVEPAWSTPLVATQKYLQAVVSAAGVHSIAAVGKVLKEQEGLFGWWPGQVLVELQAAFSCPQEVARRGGS